MREILLKILSKAKSWSDIYTDLAQLNSKNSKLAGTLFEYFCKYYYLAEPIVASDYKNVWLYEEVPQEVKEKLNIAKQDHGIDLILINHEDEYTVVQCKFRNDQSSRLSWTKDKIANLFAEADRANFEILFTNASDLDDYSKNKHAEKFQFVPLGELLNIQLETIQQMVKLIEHKPIKIKLERKPREHQIVAIKKVLTGFQTSGRGQLILPCGAGKTLTALWIKEQLNIKHTLVLVPSLALLRQIKNEWHSSQSKWLPYLCVCSERDIDNGTDVPVIHTHEIGGRVTTEVQEIRNFLSQHKETVIYSTYQSLDAISKAIGLLDFKFDLAICDEAHKTTGSKLSAFGLIHDNTKVPVKKRLYMTATPRIVSEAVKGKLGEDKIKYLADMSNLDIFGPELYRMSFAEAIQKKILVDYQIIGIGVSDAELHKQILERQFAGDDKTTIDDIANNYALEKVMEKYDVTHAITFHSSIRSAEQFKERHQKLYPKILTDHVSGLQTTNDRNVVMNRFKGSPKAIITNARCLTEGVDVPAIDVVYFCDPKNSKIDIVQASGRALRQAVHKNKKFGYIVVPIFHQEREQIEKTIESNAFRNLISVVRALCDQDERLVDEINRIKIGKGVRKPISRSLHIQIEDEMDLIVLENFEKKLKEAIFEQVIEKTGDNWMVMYEFLKEFRIKNPSKWPSNKSQSLDEKQLGHWCVTQRRSYGAKILSEDRLRKLQDINFSWDPKEEQWDEMFNKLKEFRGINPKKWPNNKYALGAWCGTQRQNYKLNNLSGERIKLLNSIGFAFNPTEEQWDIMLEELKNFRRVNTDKWPNIKSKDANERMLSRWCDHRRDNYKKGILSAEKIKQLEYLGFSWNLYDEKWNTMYDKLMDFIRKNQNAWPTHGAGAKNQLERKLGAWCGAQRKLKNRGKLNKEQIQSLEKIKFSWNPLVEKWNLMFSRLEKFRKNNPTRWPSGKSAKKEEKEIGRWCTKIRKTYKANRLIKDKINQLNLLKFSWDPDEEQWNDKFGKLQEFRKNNPNKWPSYASLNKEEKRLSTWCVNQRKSYNEKKLANKNVKKLATLGFRWNPQEEYELYSDEMFKKLQEFRENNPNRWPTHGSSNKAEKELGIWCSNRRKNYKEGNLSKDKIKALENIEFPWDALQDKWYEMLKKFKHFIIKNNNNLPTGHSKNSSERKFGKWLFRQRLAYKKEHLNQNQLKQLATLHPQWNLKRRSGPKRKTI